MTGRGRSRGQQSSKTDAAEARTGGGRGRVEQQTPQTPYVPAPAPVSFFSSKHCKLETNLIFLKTASAWGKQPAAEATPAVGLPSYRGTTAESKGRGRPQQPAALPQQGASQPQHRQEQEPGQSQAGRPQQPATTRKWFTYSYGFAR